MNKENEEYSRDLFKSLEKYDSEFTEIIYNFSQVEVEKVCKLSDKDKFLNWMSKFIDVCKCIRCCIEKEC